MFGWGRTVSTPCVDGALVLRGSGGEIVRGITYNEASGALEGGLVALCLVARRAVIMDAASNSACVVCRGRRKWRLVSQGGGPSWRNFLLRVGKVTFWVDLALGAALHSAQKQSAHTLGIIGELRPFSHFLT